jgi:hypothetical protein
MLLSPTSAAAAATVDGRVGKGWEDMEVREGLHMLSSETKCLI